RRSRFDAFYRPCGMNDSLCVEKTDGKFLIQSWSTHGDGDRLTNEDSLPTEADQNLKRFFDGQLVNHVKSGLVRRIALDPKALSTEGFILRKKGHVTGQQELRRVRPGGQIQAEARL